MGTKAVTLNKLMNKVYSGSLVNSVLQLTSVGIAFLHFSVKVNLFVAFDFD